MYIIGAQCEIQAVIIEGEMRRSTPEAQVLLWLLLVFAGCTSPAAPEVPTVADAQAFLDEANATLGRLWVQENQAGWVAQTYITPDTEALEARASLEAAQAATAFAKGAMRFDGIALPDEVRRQIDLVKLTLVMATPEDPAEARELSELRARLRSAYTTGAFCPDGTQPGSCLTVDDVARILAHSRDERQLRQVWEGWHMVAQPMRADYARFAELSNKGARDLGFADTGAMWRAKYDMPPEVFTRELDRLWSEVQPLYVKLHAFVRMKLRERYGDAVPAAGPIPAHLLGNIWAQDWSNVESIVSPADAGPAFSLTEILQSRGMSAEDMVRVGERFYVSLGFEPLPTTFWERSLFVRPQDRAVVCDASAWDVDLETDLRIKMCIQPTERDFRTIHHELGHNIYQRAYKDLPVTLRESANDAFHEAIGDTIALSITPEYLVQIGLLNGVPDAPGDINMLLARALEKVAFLPFGLLIDQWRWQVFSGQIPPSEYNQAWWALRLRYQGVAPPSRRGEQFFDPGATYHVAANTPYARYFLASILQFQFHRELSRVAGCTLPIHRCSIYGSREAGQELNGILSLGLSKPWQEALATFIGSRDLDASALLSYFAPLETWLDEQTAGQPVGW